MQNGNETVLKLVEEDYNKIFDLMCIFAKHNVRSRLCDDARR